MGKPWHRISEADVDAKTGTCSVCGPVEIRVRRVKGGTRVTECRTAIREQMRNTPSARRSKRGRDNWGRRDDYADGRLPGGITRKEARERLQGATCAICPAPAQVNDHDHASEMMRGTLCRSCNLILGMAKDSADRLRAAAEYLDRWARA